MMLTALIASVVISGLVVSAGPPSPEARADYLDWGANHVVVWQADEASYWDGIPTTVWVTPDGKGLHWTRATTEWERTPNVVREQVGDEPSRTPYALEDSETQFTNFSYWASLANGEWPEEVMPGLMAQYEGEHFTTSEYLIRDDAHWRVLDFFRGVAVENGQSWGVYLNGYRGYETEFAADHTGPELREHAYGALAFGAEEFIWFTYTFGPDGHEEAVQGGGSIITDGQSWERGSHWRVTRDINHGLHYLGGRLGESTGLEWDENIIVGEFGEDILVVGKADTSAEVKGWATRPNGVSFEVDGELPISRGDVYLVSETPGTRLML